MTPPAARRGRAAALVTPLLAGLAWMASGCWQVTRPALGPEPDEAVVPLPPRIVAAPPLAPEPDVEEAIEAEVLQALPAGPEVSVGEVRGITPSALGALLEPAHAQLERCQTSSTGKLVVRLVAEPGSTHLRVVDGSIDSETNRCVLSALGTIEVDSAFQSSASQSDAVRRVETQIVLSW